MPFSVLRSGDLVTTEAYLKSDIANVLNSLEGTCDTGTLIRVGIAFGIQYENYGIFVHEREVQEHLFYFPENDETP